MTAIRALHHSDRNRHVADTVKRASTGVVAFSGPIGS
jgi:hypothetical protein